MCGYSYECINIHITDKCNFKCKHCFVKKENYELSLDNLKIAIDKIHRYFCDKNIKGRINIAGGEPLMHKDIDNIIRYIKSKDIEVSIITNGYFLNDTFIEKHKNNISMIGISVDSLDDNTNIKIGRVCKDIVLSKEQIIEKCKQIKSNGIKLKINTCLLKTNINENFNKFINEVKPDRYKILQALFYDKNLRKEYSVSNKEVNGFIKKVTYKCLVEKAEDLKDSYLIIDSQGNISTSNSHKSDMSILKYDLDKAIDLLKINKKKYQKRYIEE